MRKVFETKEEAQEAVDAQDNLPDILRTINKRIDLLEKIFSRVMQQDLRLDTLEFNSNLPVKPGISERLADLTNRIDIVETIINQGETINE